MMAAIPESNVKKTSWRFANRIPDSPPENYRLPGIPETAVEAADIPGLGPVLLKMEHDCPTGSHKDRAAVFQVSCGRYQKASGFIIPSSGNAAIAIAAAGHTSGLPVYAFLSPYTHKGKLAAMAPSKPRIVICRNPVNRARNAATRFGMPNLRPSRDENAVKGFMSLGYALGELLTEIDFSSVFIFSTSGATLTGIARALVDLAKLGEIARVPELHAVQSGKAVGLADAFGENISDLTSRIDGKRPGFGGVADSRLYPELIAHIEASGGRGWWVSAAEAGELEKTIPGAMPDTSPEGWCALAAAIHWRKSGGKGRPLIILTGKKYHETDEEPDLRGCEICRATTYGEIERFIAQWHPVQSS